jgi:activator-of-BECN1-regulated-autophagy protein 1
VSLDARANAAANAAAMAVASSATGGDQPCTVKLRLWPYDVSDPLRPLAGPLLTIPHAVLCSEMGAHFSPCGRMMAVCCACVPEGAPEPEPGKPIPDAVYELRVYSLERRAFGEVLAARAVRAAHCLTSIQFSPTSERVMLAYGRRHSSLLLVVADGSSCVVVHTVLEVYRASDMRLEYALPSAEDEVNVACFHPAAGGGLAYGTKEGRLRVLRRARGDGAGGAGGGGNAEEGRSRFASGSGSGSGGAPRLTALGRCLEEELAEVLELAPEETTGGTGEASASDGNGSDTE